VKAQTSASRGADGRDRILAAALAEFSERGFDGASTTRIARRCGLTQPLIHYHFGSKDGLWRATVDGLFRRLRREFVAVAEEHARASRSPRETFVRMVREYVRFCGRYPQFVRLLYLEWPQRNARTEWMMDTWVRPVVEQLRVLHGWLGSQAGMVAFPEGHVMAALTGASATLFALGDFMKDAYGLDPADEATVERHADLLVTLVERGLFQPVTPVVS
jgi:AcrR family transcriptional regulator